MKFILLIVLFGAIVYCARRMMALIFGKSASPVTPVVLQPTKAEVDISITDTGQDGMPVVTIRSNGTTLNIQSIKQDSGKYVVWAKKQADNVAVIVVDKKT